jgi:hypothetical protein
VNSPSLAPIVRLLQIVRRRDRISDAATALVRFSLPAGLLLAAAAIAAHRLLGTPFELAWLAMLPVPAAILWAYARPRSMRAIARRVDAHFGLDDRLGSAMEFANPATKLGSTDPRARALADLVIRDALRAARELDPAPVAPVHLPKLRMVDALAALLLGATFLLPTLEWNDDEDALLAESEAAGKVVDDDASGENVDMTRAEPLREDLRSLTKGKDTPAKIANELLEVLEALEAGELDRAEALARLEQLEDALAEAEDELEASLEEDPWLMSEAMREMAEALKQHEITEDVAEALAKGESDEAEKSLDESMKKAESEGGDTQEQMDRALKEAEKALAKASGKNTNTASELDQAERRLKRQQKRPHEDKEEQERRLKKKQENVDRLKRQHEREKAAQRELDRLRRLSRNSRSNANSNKNKRKDSQKQLSKGAGNASRKSSKTRRMRGARDALDEAKTFIRRSGKQGEKEQRRKGQQQRFAKAAKGKKRKNGKPATMLVEGDVGDGDPSMMMEGEGQGEGEGEGEGEGQGEGEGEGQGQGEAQGEGQAGGLGDGIGSGSVDALGDESGRNVNYRSLKVNPEHGRGATRAEVIETASQEGFATESYKRVYTDYKSFAQSAMDNETMPDGQRRRVRRYFQMIQPRD